jgi:hypothetical protein
MSKTIENSVISRIYGRGRGCNIDRTLSRMVDIDKVAQALALKLGWQSQISGNGALNVMGLSAQVPTQYLYSSAI